MSSLPQGWHSNVDAPQKSLTGKQEFVSAVPMLRKKWNSPQAIGKSTATPLRRPSTTMLPNGLPSKITPPRNCAKPSFSLPTKRGTHTIECPAKPGVGSRDYQLEISNLKKEISTYKAENIVLKAKVRKLEDENNQKMRQITKLKAEIQNETVNHKRSRESEAVMLLKQKVLRLENTLKEKDQNIKRMVTEMNSVNIDELRDILMKYYKQFGFNTNGLGNNVFRKRRITEPSVGGAPETSKAARNNSKDANLKVQVDKLRNMVHKLETSNQSLQLQIKDKDQEIRRLKLQISRAGTRASVTPQRLHSSSSSQLPTSSQTDLVRGAPSRIPSAGQIRSVRSTKTTPTPGSGNQRKSIVLPKVASSRTITNAQAVPKQKPRFLPGKVKIDNRSDIERKAQIMRENIAARKIQKGWRNHRKMKSKYSAGEEKEALEFIASELMTHGKRVGKLDFFDGDYLLSSRETDSEEQQYAQDIRSAFLDLFFNNPAARD